MSKWFTQEGMDTIMSLKGIDRIRLLFSTVFPDTLPVENATYGRLNKDSSIALLMVKVNEDTFIQTEGDDDDLYTICGIEFKWWLFKCSISTTVRTVRENEQEALRNLWTYAGALRKAYSLILARHRAIGYDALDRIHRVLMIIDQVFGSYLEVDDVVSTAKHEVKTLLASETRIWDKGTFDRMLSRFVVDDIGYIKRETDPDDTATVLASMRKHAENENIIVIEDHVTSVKPIVKVFDLKVSYTYISSQLTDLIEKYGLNAKMKEPLTDVVKGMLMINLFQKHVDIVGKHEGLNGIKNNMVHQFACGHLNLVKPTLVGISEKASRLATEVTP